MDCWKIAAAMLLVSGSAFAQEAGPCGPLRIPPAASMPKDFQGATLLSVIVAADGSVADAIVAQSSGIAALDTAAVNRVKNCYRYNPQIKDGKPVESQTQLRIVWAGH